MLNGQKSALDVDTYVNQTKILQECTGKGLVATPPFSTHVLIVAMFSIMDRTFIVIEIDFFIFHTTIPPFHTKRMLLLGLSCFLSLPLWQRKESCFIIKTKGYGIYYWLCDLHCCM